ncbi:MAG: hydroxymethylbilane synthase [Sellimonas sp.]|uniref:hydroxymethylbilane synthase n=1 Tax=Sellimonas sp. TaxID=2021466 RepID=UPI0039A3814D
MERQIRIGSRESILAVRQAQIVKEELLKASPGLEIEIVTMKTTGDRILDKSLEKIGGKGLFVKELDYALLEGKIDLAVHSLKDMPMEIPEMLPILALTRREDPRDVMILEPGKKSLIPGDIIGSSSKRRTLQAGKLYPGCIFKNIRGNVQTRLQKLEQEEYNATILAAAGLRRLGMENCITRIFSIDEMIPSAGQGILAVQGRKGEKIPGIESVACPDSIWAAKAERTFVRTLDGGCTSPVAAFAKVCGNEIFLRGLYYHEAAGEYVTGSIYGDTTRGEALAEELANILKGKYE